MIKKLEDDTWIFVIVQEPGANEQFFGLHDEEADISYIPAFYNKEDAQSCMIHMPLQRGKKYEVQAIMFGDLTRDAFKNHFSVFLLDQGGKILEKIFPGQQETPVQ